MKFSKKVSLKYLAIAHFILAAGILLFFYIFHHYINIYPQDTCPAPSLLYRDMLMAAPFFIAGILLLSGKTIAIQSVRVIHFILLGIYALVLLGSLVSLFVPFFLALGLIYLILLTPFVIFSVITLAFLNQQMRNTLQDKI